MVLETDFATNYNVTRKAWVTNGTDFIGTGWNIAKTGYALTVAPLTAAEVSTQCDLALTDIHLDHLMAAAAADVIVDGSVIAHMVSATEDWSTFVPSDDSLQAIRDHATTVKTAVDAIPTTAMRGTDSANTTTPPTVVAIRQEMDSNSTQFAAIKADTVVPARNVAFPNIAVLMVLTSDHVTPATGLTVTGERSIDGGAFGNVSGTIAEISNGIYQFDAAQADMNGDIIIFRFSSATADDTFLTVTTR